MMTEKENMVAELHDVDEESKNSKQNQTERLGKTAGQ
jgi:hypothetical protein